MTKKYNFSIEIPTPEGNETFQVVNCDSFDEAIKIVKRGIYDRKLELERETEKELKSVELNKTDLNSGTVNNEAPTNPQA